MGKLTSNLQRQLSSISIILGDRVETQMEELSERQDSGISSLLLTRLSATDRPAEPPSDPLQEWLWKNSIKLTCRVPPRCVVKGKHEAVGPLDSFNTHSPCASPLHLILKRNSSCQGKPPPADNTDKLDKPGVPAVSIGQEDNLASHMTSKAASPVTPAKESSGNLAAMQNCHKEVELDVDNTANSLQKGSAELSKETQILSVNLQNKAKSQDQPHEIQSWRSLETQSRNISQVSLLQAQHLVNASALSQCLGIYPWALQRSGSSTQGITRKGLLFSAQRTSLVKIAPRKELTKGFSLASTRIDTSRVAFMTDFGADGGRHHQAGQPAFRSATRGATQHHSTE